MPRPRSRRKGHSDWAYVVKLKHNEAVPLLTTQDGVRLILAHDTIKGAEADEHLQSIDTGGVYAPHKGLFRSVHRQPDTVETWLHNVSFTIRVSGHYNVCWWHKPSGTVVWTYAHNEGPATSAGLQGEVAAGSIRSTFLAHREVRRVRVLEEVTPDLKRDSRWLEVYPGFY
jgi:hypothetical protein